MSKRRKKMKNPVIGRSARNEKVAGQEEAQPVNPTLFVQRRAYKVSRFSPLIARPIFIVATPDEVEASSVVWLGRSGSMKIVDVTDDLMLAKGSACLNEILHSGRSGLLFRRKPQISFWDLITGKRPDGEAYWFLLPYRV